MLYDIIVSRHAGAVEWLRHNLLPQHHPAVTEGVAGDATFPLRLAYYSVGLEPVEELYDSIPIVAVATEDDVRGKHVVGNLPLHLAALAASVTIIDFTGDAPRGAEYTAEQMVSAGAVLRSYRVIPTPSSELPLARWMERHREAK